MNNPDEILAWLLAADEHPCIEQEPGFAEARAQVDASPELRQALAEARDFARRHPRLVGFDQMPRETRERIRARLLSEVLDLSEAVGVPELSPWSFRRQFAWAAVLALFLAGLSVFSSKIIEHQNRAVELVRHLAPPDMAAGQLMFHQFVRARLHEPVAFQHAAAEPALLVNWLEENQGYAPPLPESLRQARGRGCAVLESPEGKVSLLCVEVQGQVLKLYITCAKRLRLDPAPPRPLVLDQHRALEWSDEANAFMLIQSIPEAPLPEILL